MTTPGGVPNLPLGALTIDTMADRLQNLTGDAMKSRAVERFPAIFNTSTGLNPSLDITPFGILTRIWAEINSLIANADPADIDGPDDLPPLLLNFIEGLPVVGELVGLLEAILGTYTGDDPTLVAIQDVFAPIRALVDALTAITGGGGGFGGFFPDLLGILGNPAGLGTGSPVIPGLSSIPILGPVFGLFGGATDSTQAGNFFTNMLGLLDNPTLTATPASFNINAAASDFVSNILNPTGLLASLSTILGWFGAADSTQADNFFTNMLAALGDPTLTGSPGSFDPQIIPSANLVGTITEPVADVVDGFANIFDGWFGGTTATGTPAEVATTIASIKSAVLDGYTVETFTSNGSWTVAANLVEVWYIVIGGGGKGANGTGNNTSSGGTGVGGAAGSSGGYRAEQIDPATLTSGGSVSVTVGAAGATSGADGGTTTIGSISNVRNIGSISSVGGYTAATSAPGQGGKGGDANATTPSVQSGADGEASALGAAGDGGAGNGGSGSRTGTAGTAGGTASITGATKSGGGGGGGGGGAYTTSGLTNATGGAGGAAGYPGGGSGGGGGASSPNTSSVTGGTSGAAANGVAFIMYKAG